MSVIQGVGLLALSLLALPAARRRWRESRRGRRRAKEIAALVYSTEEAVREEGVPEPPSYFELSRRLSDARGDAARALVCSLLFALSPAAGIILALFTSAKGTWPWALLIIAIAVSPRPRSLAATDVEVAEVAYREASAIARARAGEGDQKGSERLLAVAAGADVEGAHFGARRADGVL